MRKVSLLGIYMLLILSIPALISCGGENKDGEIQGLDQRYLSESQLFALNRAIGDDPDNAENYYKRAKVYLERNQEDKALLDIDKSIKIKNTEGKFYLLQARILESSNQLMSALQAALTAESLKANTPEVKVLLAKLYLKLNQKEKAKEYLSMAALLTPHHSDISFLAGKLAALNGDTTGAIRYCMESLQKDGSNVESYKELSTLYFNKAKYDSAMIFVSRGRSIEPENAFFYYMDGRLCEHFQLKQAAKASYLNSIKFDSSFSEGYRALALIAYKEEDHYNAAKYFEKELTYNPNSLKSAALLAEIYEMQNRGQLAIPLWERIFASDTTNVKAKASLDRLYVLFPKKVAPAPLKDSVKKETESMPVPAPDAAKKPASKPVVKDTVVNKTKPVPRDTTTVRRTKPAVADTSSDKIINRKPEDSSKERGIFKRRNKKTDSTSTE